MLTGVFGKVRDIMILQYVMELSSDFWRSALGIFWFFVISVMVASAISSLQLHHKVVHFFEKAGIWSTIGALFLGLVSPL